MLNIVIPLAGRGSRFAERGYADPKPFIPIHGHPMIELVIENLRPKCPHRFIFICLEEHLIRFEFEKRLLTLAGSDSKVIAVNQVTEGAACTVLLAREYIDNSTPLMIANSDQWVDSDINLYLKKMDQDNLDGLIMTMKADDPKWSFVRLDKSNLVTEVVEKQVVSDEATVGIYNFKSGKDYVQAAEEMIAQNLRVNGEFYVAPTYNQLIQNKKRIGIFNIGSDQKGMYGLGTPTDLEWFLAHSIVEKATKHLSAR